MLLKSQNKLTNYHKLLKFSTVFYKNIVCICAKNEHFIEWYGFVGSTHVDFVLCFYFLLVLFTQRMPQYCTSKMTVCREKHSTGSYKIFIRVGADKEWVHE